MSLQRNDLKSKMEIPEEGDEEGLRRFIANLSPKAKAQLAARVNQRLDVELKVWFCGDRTCDGLPHDVYNYPHARGSKRPDMRGSQYPPVGIDWYTWLLGAGRGAGKTRTGSQYSLYISGHIPFLALIGPTGPAVRSVMIEGPSGLVRACEAAGKPGVYEPSKARFTFSNGAVASLFSAEEPDRIRGGNFGFFWGDEPAHWDDPQEAWDQALFANRVGKRPHALATTTPLPSEFIKGLMAAEDTIYVGGSTYDNMANLAEVVVRKILAKYEGTFLGRQEIHGEIIDDREGALWSSEQFAEDDFYFEWKDVEGTLDRIVVGIDPAGSQNKRSDLTGIIVGGKRGEVLHAIDDLSGKYSPSGWARKAIWAYETYKADAIVVERNFGGDMVRATLRAEKFEGRIIEAKATDGKRVRAEPIAAKYEQHLARHRRGGKVQKLESEQVSWIPGEGKSPNRVDAWVWCATSLIKGGGKASYGDPTSSGTTIGAEKYKGPGSLFGRKRAQMGRR